MWNPAGPSIEADMGDDGSIRLFVAVGVVSRPSPRRIYRFSSELVSWFLLEVRSHDRQSLQGLRRSGGVPQASE
jgi:hypothetical protein